MQIDVDCIAQVCHEANRGYQAAFPQEAVPVAPPWDECSDEMQLGIVLGVRKALEGANPREMHEAWCENKVANGWVWGAVKSEEGKLHPCLMDYDELPEAHRRKDELFLAVVHALDPRT